MRKTAQVKKEIYLPEASSHQFLNHRWLKILIALVFLGLMMMAVLILNKDFLKPKEPSVSNSGRVAIKNTIISGTIDFNGVAEPESTLAIGIRPAGEKDFQIKIQDLPAQDGAVWSWNQAVPDKNYDIQAYLLLNGETLAKSAILTVTAPATEEILTLNAKAKTSLNELASISGELDLNGYLPADSTISLLKAEEGQDPQLEGQMITQGIKVQDKQMWTWDGAVKGQTYVLRALLEENGSIIGQSDDIQVTAPASNEVLRIHSRAIPPATAPVKAGISGKINLNGQPPAGSRIVIFQRPADGGPNTVAVDNLAPVDNTSWYWPNAVAGTHYVMFAVLKVKQNNTDTDYAYSNNLSVAAPANNEILILNTAITLPAPTTLPSVSCGTENNQHIGNITLMTIDGAQQYWLQIGTAENNADVLSFRFKPGQINQPDMNHLIYKQQVDPDKWYYARYAYTRCQDCGDLVDFSNFSHPQSFQCK